MNVTMFLCNANAVGDEFHYHTIIQFVGAFNLYTCFQPKPGIHLLHLFVIYCLLGEILW